MAWDYSGREPEVSRQTMPVAISLIRKATKWRQQSSGFLGKFNVKCYRSSCGLQRCESDVPCDRLMVEAYTELP